MPFPKDQRNGDQLLPGGGFHFIEGAGCDYILAVRFGFNRVISEGLLSIKHGLVQSLAHGDYAGQVRECDAVSAIFAVNQSGIAKNS